MAGGLPIDKPPTPARRAGASLRILLVLSVFALAWASEAPAAPPSGEDARRGGPPREAPGVPAPEELEAAGAVIGQVFVDNQNIFDLEDPRDDNWLFRAADDLHIKTKPAVIRTQLLFRPGDPYNRRLIDESERILRADGYFYDA